MTSLSFEISKEALVEDWRSRMNLIVISRRIGTQREFRIIQLVIQDGASISGVRYRDAETALFRQ
jgi:hypothetical protein